MQENDFSYCASCELNFPIVLMIQDFDYKLIQIQLIQSNKEIEKINTNSKKVVFNTKYKDLTLDSLLLIKVFGKRKSEYNGKLKLFDKKNTLLQSRHRVTLYTKQEDLLCSDEVSNHMVNDDQDRIDYLMRNYYCGDIARVDWLDEKLNQYLTTLKPLESNFLYVNFPIFDFPVVFKELEYSHSSGIILRELDTSYTIFDPELLRDNPVESKHRKLARSHRTGPLDRELKPNPKTRDELVLILRYPPTKQLSDSEKNLLWKFRFYLTREKKALTKFVKCVIWDDPIESKQAAELLALWVEIDVEDALELLCPEFTDQNVRIFAVDQLRRADDTELQLYLLQLIQAIKFENNSSSALIEFLINRGINNEILGNYFYWYLMVECQDKSYGRMYGKVAFKFLSALVKVTF
jgi:phosphatidylinositol 3-kinase